MTRNILITGGAGFIGVNTAEHFLKKKDKVTIFDNFSRNGSKENIKYLKQNYKNLKVIVADIRFDYNKLLTVVKDADVVFHLAAQVAVTTSVDNPREDLEINILGTFNVLEAIRNSKKNPILLYSSTNKVYGNLKNLKINENKTNYSFSELKYGVPEILPVDFYSPYGCSKGSADQYVHDYARIYGLRTIVFRQSCIYGPRQFGMEDQGWIAWFIIALILNKKITIYGDGKQVRDLLFVEDLINAYDLAVKNINKTAGQIYNIGGGSKNSLSVWHELSHILNDLFDKDIKVNFENERPGDQKIYISDIRKAKKDFGWEPSVGTKEGIGILYSWVKENKSMIKKIFK